MVRSLKKFKLFIHVTSSDSNQQIGIIIKSFLYPKLTQYDLLFLSQFLVNYFIFLLLSFIWQMNYNNHLHSPRSKDSGTSDYGSFTVEDRKHTNQSIFTRKMANDIFDQRQKTYTYLQSFYMPYLKKVYQQNKFNHPSLKSPQELFFNSRLLEMRDVETKRKIQSLQAENQFKDRKILQLNNKLASNIQKLKFYEPAIMLDLEISANDFQESERRVKRIENILKIKNQEAFFRLRIKVSNLLQEFQLSKQETDGMKQLQSQNDIFDYMIHKLKIKIKDFKVKQKYFLQETNKEKQHSQRLSDQLKRISQAYELSKINEIKLKQRHEDVKKQWSTSNDKLITAENQLQMMEVQVYRLKRILQQKDSLLLKSNSITSTKSAIADDLKKQYEHQIKDQRTLLTSYNIEINELKQQLQDLTEEVEEFKIRQKFKNQQIQKNARQHTRWKERCQWYEKQKNNNSNHYQQKNKNLQIEIQRLKNSISEVQTIDAMSESRNLQLKNNCQLLKSELNIKNQKLRMLQQKCTAMEHEKKMKQLQLQQNSNHTLKETMRQKQQEFQKKLIAKQNETRQYIQQVKKIYEQKSQAKQSKYIQQIRNLQVQLESTRHPLIQKKSDYLASRILSPQSSRIKSYQRI